LEIDGHVEFRVAIDMHLEGG